MQQVATESDVHIYDKRALAIVVLINQINSHLNQIMFILFNPQKNFNTKFF